MRKYLFLLIVHLSLMQVQSFAQVDAHFTQYFAYPQWLNPAFTGAMNGSYRVAGNYRKQWPNLSSALLSQGVSADISLPKNFGIGFTLFNQKTDDGGYHYTSGYLSLSYQVHLTQYQILASGFQFGFLNRRVDPANFQFGNQFNPLIGFDPTIPSNESFAYPSATSMDGSFGLIYFDGDPNHSLNPFLGFSVYHPTEPDNRFISSVNQNKVPIRYSMHGGLRIKMNDRIDLLPNAIYLSQAGSNELIAGLSLNIKIDPTKDFIVGSNYRINDAIAPNIGLHIDGLTIGFSYDVNTSQVKTSSLNNGGYEISVSFIKPKKSPDTKFVCPRL
ncbi:MAG: PorP/SprF family type IX secretion system membrane protein [Bacteroidota bacterium]